MFPLGRRYTSRQCYLSREALLVRASVTAWEPSDRAVVSWLRRRCRIGVYCQRKRPEPSVPVGFAEGMNFASAASGAARGTFGEDGFTRRARFQVKLNMKLRDRSGPRGAFPVYRQIQRIANRVEHASYSCAVSERLILYHNQNEYIPQGRKY